MKPIINDELLFANAFIKQAIAQSIDRGIAADTMIDRLLTYGAFYAVSSNGKQQTAADFRDFADKIEAGLFDNVDQVRINQ